MGCSYAGCGLAHDYALLTLDRDIGNQVRALQLCTLRQLFAGASVCRVLGHAL